MRLWCVFDIAKTQERIAQLERLSAVPGFWDDVEHAQKEMQELTRLKEEAGVWLDLAKRVSDLVSLLAMAREEEDEGMAAEISADVERAHAELEKLEFRLMFSGPYDRRDALVSIYAGAGGTESQDWASMLLRMYLRWAEQSGYEAEILDTTPGEEAGVKSVTFSVTGQYAYGYLRSEKGVHRLVRLSPFDSAHRRHTSFALVEVMPDIEDEIEIEIKPDDVRVDVFRAAGAGGQHMQKNATAVRITHEPTGIVATCQNERSQAQNRAMAMRVLRARLFALEEARQEQQLAKIKGEHVSAGWGTQIRSYVLHPYRMVKDLRTDYETGNSDAVLNGNLDGFMHAYLESTMAEAPQGT
jgi:peptide chain release factor 2